MACRTIKIILFLSVNLVVVSLSAQNERYGEVAVHLGGNYYLGDLNHIPFRNIRPVGGIFYRHNMNPRFAVKGFGYGGLLNGSGETPNNVNVSFNKLYGQINALGEFNFIPFEVGKNKSNYTTYLQSGVGLIYYPNKSGKIFLFDIPMGMGFKMNLLPRFVFGADFLMYKTFADHIDYQGSHISSEGVDHQNYYDGNKDWISYFGIYLAYKIEYPEKCPAFD